MTLSGNQKRQMKSAARLFAVQALYQMEQTGQTVDRVRVEFEDHALARSSTTTPWPKATRVCFVS